MYKKRNLKFRVTPLAICMVMVLVSCSERIIENDVALNTPSVEPSAAKTPIPLPTVAIPNEQEVADAHESPPETSNGRVKPTPKPLAEIAASIASQAPAETPEPPVEPLVIPPIEEIKQEEEPPIEEDFPFAPFPYAFAANDIYGNAVTQADLGEKRLFFIHHWATWCSSCVSGMPALAKVAEAYGDRVGFIGLVDDYSSSAKKAQKIAEDSGVPSSFIMVNANAAELKKILGLVESGYFPTSVIIDGSAEVFEPKLIGSYGERYAQLLDILLE